MKKTFLPRLVCMVLLLSGAFTACKKDSNPTTPNTQVAPPGNPFPDTLTVSPVNTPLDVFPASRTYPDVWMVAVGTKIYFGNGSESGNPVINRFFASYDVSTNTLTKGLPTTNATCNCGYSGRLLTDGNAIYHFSNNAAKYTPATNAWTVPAYPPSASNKLGEPGTAVVGSKMYHLGGRAAGKAFIYYDAVEDNWFAAPDYPHEVMEPLLIAVDKKVYAFGGGITPETKNKSAVFDTETNTWQGLPDIPKHNYFSRKGYSAATDGKRIFINEYDSVRLYNVAGSAFRPQSFYIGSAINQNVGSRSLFFIGGRLYLAGYDEKDNRFVLYELVVK